MHPLAASTTNPSSHAVKNDAEQRATVGDGNKPRHADAEKPRGTGDDARVRNRRGRGGVRAGVSCRVEEEPVRDVADGAHTQAALKAVRRGTIGAD